MTLVCKDKDGTMLSEKKQILERWQQCFEELLNPKIGKLNNVEIHEGSINKVELNEPMYEEINEIIKNLKSNKAAGPDDINYPNVSSNSINCNSNSENPHWLN
jgi:phosphoglycolate phosphatase-like HAD superfamily hydrolase